MTPRISTGILAITALAVLFGCTETPKENIAGKPEYKVAQEIITTKNNPDKINEKSIVPGFITRLPERFTDIPSQVHPTDCTNEPDYFILPDTSTVREMKGIISEVPGQPGWNSFSVDIPKRPGHDYPDIQKFRISNQIYISVIFDNDIFGNTDYYYTSGLTIAFYHPALRNMPGAVLLPSAGKGSVNHYALSLTQTLFTPIDPDKGEVQLGDRPFASYLVLGQANISNNPLKKFRLTSRLDLGVIGPAALGGYVQKTLHDIEPAGWQNQVSNDLVLNYFFRADKGARPAPHVEVIGSLGAEAGTLRTNLSGGGLVRFSNAKGYFESVFLSVPGEKGKNRVSFYFDLEFTARLIAHDATLQGGFIDQKRDIYTLHASDIRRVVFQARAGAGISYGRFAFEAGHHFLTPEFSRGRTHMWSRLSASFRI